MSSQSSSTGDIRFWFIGLATSIEMVSGGKRLLQQDNADAKLVVFANSFFGGVDSRWASLCLPK